MRRKEVTRMAKATTTNAAASTVVTAPREGTDTTVMVIVTGIGIGMVMDVIATRNLLVELIGAAKTRGANVIVIVIVNVIVIVIATGAGVVVTAVVATDPPLPAAATALWTIARTI